MDISVQSIVVGLLAVLVVGLFVGGAATGRLAGRKAPLRLVLGMLLLGLGAAVVWGAGPR